MMRFTPLLLTDDGLFARALCVVCASWYTSVAAKLEVNIPRRSAGSVIPLLLAFSQSRDYLVFYGGLPPLALLDSS